MRQKFAKIRYVAVIISFSLIFLIGKGVHDAKSDNLQFVISNIHLNNEESILKMPSTFIIPELTTFEKIEKRAMNVPNELLEENGHTYEADEKCSPLPKLKQIIFDNTYWQKCISSSGIILYLYSAYYDNRKIKGGDDFIRVNAIKSGPQKFGEIYCKFWYKYGKQVKSISTNLKNYKMKDLNSTFSTQILNCKVPLDIMEKIPFGISVTEKKKCGKVTNILSVDYSKSHEDVKKGFAVCTKGLDYPFKDVSNYLTEWIELLGIMGVDKVYFYDLNVHPNISLVLQYYAKKGKIEVLPLSLPGNQPNSPGPMHDYLTTNIHTKRAQEKLPYNDCLHRNMNKYRFIANLDIDEIIIPRRTNTWGELFHYISKKNKNVGTANPSSYSFKRFLALNKMSNNHSLVEEIPKSMYMLQNVYRSQKSEGGSKSILDTNLVIGTSNHKPTKCNGDCTHYEVPNDQAFILHYRSSCKQGRDKFCDEENSIKDTNILKYKSELMRRTSHTLSELKLIS